MSEERRNPPAEKSADGAREKPANRYVGGELKYPDGVSKPKGVHITCGRCEQLLAISYGNHLDCFAFVIEHRVKMKCERCGNETRWAPEKNKQSVDAPESSD